MIIPRSFGLKKCGIYCITNTITNKCYIGSSKNIYYRLKRHYSNLERQNHQNPYLLNSYIKHGKNAFTVKILEETSFELLAQKEQYYIDTLKPKYNIVIDVVRQATPLSCRKKISETLKDKYRKGILIPRRNDEQKKPVVIYDKDCNCVGTYESESAAGKMLEKLYPGLKKGSSFINMVINHKNRLKNNKYKDHYFFRPNIPCVIASTDHHSAVKIKCENSLTKEITIYDSILEAAKVLKCTKKVIYKRFKKPNMLYKHYKISKQD
jgi:group I intron endonuclease